MIWTKWKKCLFKDRRALNGMDPPEVASGQNPPDLGIGREKAEHRTSELVGFEEKVHIVVSVRDS